MLQNRGNKYQQFPSKSVQGWIIIASNLHQEIQEDDVFDAFTKYGEIKSLHLNMDRKTGYAKGYALIEYGQLEQATAAVNQMNDQELLDKKISVAFAFEEKPLCERKKTK